MAQYCIARKRIVKFQIPNTYDINRDYEEKSVNKILL